MDVDAVVRQRQLAMEGRNRGVVNAELATGIAADAVDAQAQFQNAIFQALRLDEQSCHNCSEFLPTLRADKTEVERKMKLGA